MKKLLALLLTFVMITGLVACQSKPAENPGGAEDPKTETQAPETEAPAEVGASGTMHKIGVIVYSTTESQTIAFKDYYQNYITSVFEDVEFVYSDSVSDAEGLMKTLQDMIDFGCEGIMENTSFDLKAEVELCEKNQVYLMRPSATIADADYEAVKNNPYFVGSIGPGSAEEKQAGIDVTTALLAKEELADEKSFFIFSGGASVHNVMHYMRTLGVLETIEGKFGVKFADVDALAASEAVTTETAGDVTVTIVPGYIETEPFLTPAVEAMEAYEGKAVISTIPCDSFYQTIENKGMKLAMVDCYCETNQVLFDHGFLVALTGKYASTVGPSFAAMYNAVTGNLESFRQPDGTALRGVIDFWTSADKADYDEKYAYSSSLELNAYNYDDLYQVCKPFNSDANYDSLIKLIEANSFEDAVARRAK